MHGHYVYQGINAWPLCITRDKCMAIMYIKWKCKTGQSASWASNCLWPFIQPSFNVQYSIIIKSAIFVFIIHVFISLLSFPQLPFGNGHYGKQYICYLLKSFEMHTICDHVFKCIYNIYQCYLLRNDQSLLVMFGTRMLFCRFLFVKWCETYGILPPFKVLC